MGFEAVKSRIIRHLSFIYPDEDQEVLAERIIDTFWPVTGKRRIIESHLPCEDSWSENTAMVITYGDSLKKEGEFPLHTLQRFLHENLKDTINSVHILPFFPYSSDDGFAVMDYEQVREDLGNWDDITAIGKDFSLMSDMVLNHASSRGKWFEKFQESDPKYKDFFFTAPEGSDVSMVVRPRPSPLLTAFDTAEGLRHVWCTFGADQVDLNFANPDVLVEFVKIMRLYLDNNVRILRMDAVAFLWKEVGSPSIHMPQTHEIVRLFRTLADFFRDDVLIITETNVPHNENLTYFGNQNEAHLIYNFALPPLLVQALLTGREYYLKKWLMELPPTQEGCAYLNFVASHDGIGLRPAKGILMDADLDEMIRTIRSFGGEISMRTGEDGKQSPYEMNISLYDALKGTIHGEDDLGRERFLASQTIMMALEGVPAFYIHSLLATRNDYDKFRESGHRRHINRYQWDYDALNVKLNDKTSDENYIFNEVRRLINIRIAHKSFHPNATQFALHLPEGFFGFWRQSLDRKECTFCITNLTKQERTLHLHALNLYSGQNWCDLITEQCFKSRDQDVIFAPYQSMWISNTAL